MLWKFRFLCFIYTLLSNYQKLINLCFLFFNNNLLSSRLTKYFVSSKWKYYKSISYNNYETEIEPEKKINLVMNLPAKITLNYNFPSYLAGLIEGDGSIIVPGQKIHSYNPYFEIVFHIRDLIIAKYIPFKIGGNIYIKENYCYLKIKDFKSVLKIIHLINGNMRTPKIEALNRMIEWFNSNSNLNIKLLNLDRSNLSSNSWLSGFIDADGSFYLNWGYDKKRKASNLQYYMRISQKQTDKNSNSYVHIMSQISSFLSVPLRKRERKRKLSLKYNNYSIEKSYEVRSGSYISNYIIISYLLKYPLFGYKYSAISVYVEWLKMTKNKEYKLDFGLEKFTKLKDIIQYSHDKELFIRKTLSHHAHIIQSFPF